MGLDFVEVMMAIEDKFGVTIVSGEFDLPEKKVLVKDLYDIVERNTCKQAAAVLESQGFQEKTFEDVRHTFADGLELAQSDFWDKETTLKQLYDQIPTGKRKKIWKKFRSHYKIRTQSTILHFVNAKYKRHLLAAWCGYFAFVFVIPACVGQCFWQLGLVVPVIFFVPGSIFWLYLWGEICERHRNAIPPNVTLGEIADHIIVQHRKSLKEDGSPYTRSEIEEIVKQILCCELGLKPEDVTPEADLVRDLGMG